MKRLTEKQNGEYILPYDGENLLTISTSRNTVMIGDFKYVTTPNITYLSGKFINEFGELEDVLEKYKIKNLEEYISALNEARNFAIKERSAMFNKYIKETIKTEELETELAELRQNAIIPKYQIGQKVFIILDGTVKETNIDSITIFVGNELSYYCKYVDGKRIYLELAEDEIFTTKEEAEQGLVGIGGGKR